MKVTLGLILIAGITLSSSLYAQEKVRTHLKCYLQLEDKSAIVHHFVNTDKESKEFIENLTQGTVFMADGITEQKIVEVYECVDIKGYFKSKEAQTVEENTPF